MTRHELKQAIVNHLKALRFRLNTYRQPSGVRAAAEAINGEISKMGLNLEEIGANGHGFAWWVCLGADCPKTRKGLEAFLDGAFERIAQKVEEIEAELDANPVKEKVEAMAEQAKQEQKETEDLQDDEGVISMDAEYQIMIDEMNPAEKKVHFAKVDLMRAEKDLESQNNLRRVLADTDSEIGRSKSADTCQLVTTIRLERAKKALAIAERELSEVNNTKDLIDRLAGKRTGQKVKAYEVKTRNKSDEVRTIKTFQTKEAANSYVAERAKSYFYQWSGEISDIDCVDLSDQFTRLTLIVSYNSGKQREFWVSETDIEK